jgi:hypothetical protein
MKMKIIKKESVRKHPYDFRNFEGRMNPRIGLECRKMCQRVRIMGLECPKMCQIVVEIWVNEIMDMEKKKMMLILWKKMILMKLRIPG